MKRIAVVLLSISIGILFIFSAVAKINAMEPFEYQLVDIGVASWQTAPYLARFFIALELFLGFLLVLNIALKKFTIRVAVALLLFFTSYLLYRIYTDGNSGNCGCFGEMVKMTPLEGIYKNIVLLISCMVCYIAVEKEYWNMKWKKILLPVLFIAALCIGFFSYPVNIRYISSLDKKIINYKVPLELMYSERQKEKPKIDLTKGKHIVAFLSLTCPHCRIAAKKINVIHKKNPQLPFYFALNGDKEMLKEFLEDTQTKSISCNLFLGPKDWQQVAGMSLPNIMYIENSIVHKKCNLPEIDQEDMEQWMKK